MEPTLDILKLRSVVSAALSKHGLNDLAIEMEVTTAVRDFLNETLIKKRNAETVRNEILQAMAVGSEIATEKHDIALRVEIELMDTNSDDGMDFVNFAYLRAKQGEDIETFIRWWKKNQPDPIYWSFRRMRQLWRHAFPPRLRNREQFVQPKQKAFAPAPDFDEADGVSR